jgi:hypothetical protein
VDREVFQLTNFPSGTYQLTIDGQPIRTYASDELARGVNLATESKTPEARQAQKVWNAYKTRLESVFKLRTIASVERAAFAPDLPHPTTLQELEPLLDAYLKREAGSPWETAIAGELKAYRVAKPQEAQLRASMDSEMKQIRELAQPKPHFVEFSRLTMR